MAGECIHHFIIEEPNGPQSEGVCKNCGAEKQFSNSFLYEGAGPDGTGTGRYMHKLVMVSDPQYYPKSSTPWGNRLA